MEKEIRFLNELVKIVGVLEKYFETPEFGAKFDETINEYINSQELDSKLITEAKVSGTPLFLMIERIPNEYTKINLRVFLDKILRARTLKYGLPKNADDYREFCYILESKNKLSSRLIKTLEVIYSNGVFIIVKDNEENRMILLSDLYKEAKIDLIVLDKNSAKIEYFITEEFYNNKSYKPNVWLGKPYENIMIVSNQGFFEDGYITDEEYYGLPYEATSTPGFASTGIVSTGVIPTDKEEESSIQPIKVDL